MNQDALAKASERIADLEKQVEIKHNQRAEIAQWFEHRSGYGTFTLEQIDAMSPRELADHCYERKAEQVEVLTDKLADLTKDRDELKVELGAWQSSFDTTQLSHALAAVDVIKSHHEHTRTKRA